MICMVIMQTKQSKTVKSEAETITKKSLVEQFSERKFRNTRSYSTRKTCKSALVKFEDFLKIEKNLTIEQLKVVLVDQKLLDPITLLDEFYTYLRNCEIQNKRKKTIKIGYSNGAIRAYLIIAKEFLRFFGLKIYNEDIKQVFKLPPKEEPEEELLTKEVINRVLRNSNQRLQTVILILCSSGMRLGELVQLRLGDIDFTTNPTTITLRKSVVKGKIIPRKTQLTTEATKALKDYLTREFQWFENTNHADLFVFLQTHENRLEKYKQKIKQFNEGKTKLTPEYEGSLKQKIPLLENQLKTLSEEERYNRSVDTTKSNIERMIQRTVDSIPELAKTHENGIRDIHFHAFRAWFKTQVTDAQQSDFAEALMGHKSLNLRYYRQNDRKRLEIYRKVESALTISDFEKIEKNIVQVTENYQDMKEQLKNLQEQFNILLAQTRPQKA